VPEIDRWNGVGYTSAFVVLDYPAGTLPVRDVSNDDLKDELPESEVLGGWDSRNRDLCKLSTFIPLVFCLRTTLPCFKPLVTRFLPVQKQWEILSCKVMLIYQKQGTQTSTIGMYI
jgi:hypothetical protein